MAQGLGLARGFSLLEQRQFACQALLQRQQTGGLHRREHQARRQTAFPARLLLDAVTFEEVCFHTLGRISKRLARAGRGAAGDQLAGILTGAGKQVFGAVGEAVDNPQLQGAFGRDLGTTDHHLQCRLYPDQPRQALGSTGTGEQAEVDFRQADAGLRFADAITTGQGQLKTATQGEFANGGNQWLVEPGQAQQDVGQIRCGKGCRAAELSDIGAGTEQPRGTEDDDGTHRRIAVGLFARLQQGGA
ncbi:hypothetical protein D3C81_1200990 [compost metagenome]